MEEPAADASNEPASAPQANTPFTKLEGRYDLSGFQNSGEGSPGAALATFHWAIANHATNVFAQLKWQDARGDKPGDSETGNEMQDLAYKLRGVTGVDLDVEQQETQDQMIVGYNFIRSPDAPPGPKGGVLTLRRVGDQWKVVKFDTFGVAQ